jgi:hypothetical protein
MVRTHQPGQTIFRSILPEDVDWKPVPAFPPSVRLAVVVGQPSEPGLYTIRVKVPSGVKSCLTSTRRTVSCRRSACPLSGVNRNVPNSLANVC